MSSYKNLVHQIKKIAKGLDDLPDVSLPAETPGLDTPVAKPAPGKTNVHRPGSNQPTIDPKISRSVRLMQQAIRGLFETVSANPEFTDHLIEQYKIPSSAVEYFKKPVAMDGVWGKDTSNSLNAVGYLANGIAKVLDNFGGVAPNSKAAFRTTDAAQLISLFPKSQIPFKDEKVGLAEKADAISKSLDRLDYFYQNYPKQVMNSETFKQVADKNKVLMSLTPEVPERFAQYLSPTKENLDFLQKSVLTDLTLPNATNQPTKTSISLWMLSNPANFQAFLKQTLGYSDEQLKDPNVQNNVLGSLQQQITSKMQPASR